MNYESTISGQDIGVATQEETEQKVRRRWIIIAVVVAALVVAAAAYFAINSAGTAGEEAATEEDGQAPVVTVTSPGTQTISRTINATGSLAARHEIPVGVVGEGGRVTRVYVDAGDWVKQGQVMASIDQSVQNQQIASLQASIGASRADLDLAQANLDRAMKLVERGFISKADIDRLTANRDSAAARLRVSQAQLGEARARNARLSIVAPKGGFVLERAVEPGQTVTQGSGILFRIAQNGEMELQARLSEEELANLSVGVSVDVIPVGTNKTFTGQVWQISPTIDAQSRQGIARVALSYDRALRPGGFASAQIRAGSAVAPLLPHTAVLSDKTGSYVYIVSKANKAVRRDIKTGLVTSDGVTVTEGLSGNESVVLFAGGFLNPGELVKPEKQKKSPAPVPAGT
ncbi:efflux RND transporter periplasmic adaptor subunit [Parasphingorhabdus halotolerans]|uniref:Efflux RND transporter periplasmic adaptor subunit n=1 Tax=Parasphingorhabdus halotolerans TaxID=2725558 RepID=A0A6H2DMB2_9SPHN|nr:efflux RND transporter periplasmic adaptor subunit [Parasphingorhabdus halotolerans]QJB69520.1 efflux RND transporter periplasmic adaptor subunit [Parasphingorhabdus halotolerans]